MLQGRIFSLALVIWLIPLIIPMKAGIDSKLNDIREEVRVLMRCACFSGSNTTKEA